MGKVNKRQRKFLSKNVLPHRKKGGVRRDSKPKGGGNKGGGKEDARAQAAGEQQEQQQRKTLPDGLDTAAFLECAWLTRDACAAAGRDTCAPPFEPDAAVLEGGSGGGTSSKRSKRGNSVGGGRKSGGLTGEAARAMVGQAVDKASVDDLFRVVWALQAAAAAAAAPGSSAEEGGCQALRADPASEAAGVLRSEAFSRLHLAFRAHLGPEREEGDTLEEWEDATRAHRQQLERADAWPSLGGALLSFLTAALDHMEAELEVEAAAAAAAPAAASTAALVDGLARMRDHVPLLFPFPRLARRYLAFLLAVLGATDDAAALSLAFVRLYELSTSQPMPFLHDAFKGSYRCYRAAAERVGAGGKGVAAAAAAAGGARGGNNGGAGAGTLPLLRECFAELFGVEKPSAYLHAYVYIHELAREALAAAAEVRKAGGKPKEAGPALRRLRSWEFLQSLLLWNSVVVAHPAKSSLGPLVPPLSKALEITLQLSPGLYGAPRTLALSRAAQDLAAAAGVFLPTSHHLVGLLELLHAREGRRNQAGGDSSSPPDGGKADRELLGGKGAVGAGKKRGRGGGGGVAAAAEVDLSAIAGLGKEDLRLAEVQAAVCRGAAGLIAREVVCYRWSAGLPELCAGTGARLGRLLDDGGSGLPADGGAGRLRARVRALHSSLQKAAAEAVARRARGSKHPGEAGPVDTFRGMEESTATQRLRAFKEPS